MLHGAALRRLAHTQQVTDEAVPAQRGTITDRNGTVLAISEPADDISATPYLVKEPLRRTAERLAPLLGRPQAQVLTDLSERSGFVYLARALPAARAQAVLALNIPGIAGTPTMRRVYPRGALAGQVLGVVGDNRGEGLSGLEYADNAILRGRRASGGWSATRRASRSRSPTCTARQPGAQLRLTLDANIQQRSEAVLNAVGRVFHPQRRDCDRDEPGHGRGAGDGELAAAEPERQREVGPRGSAGEPRGELQLRTGLDLQGR